MAAVCKGKADAALRVMSMQALGEAPTTILLVATRDGGHRGNCEVHAFKKTSQHPPSGYVRDEGRHGPLSRVGKIVIGSSCCAGEMAASLW